MADGIMGDETRKHGFLLSFWFVIYWVAGFEAFQRVLEARSFTNDCLDFRHRRVEKRQIAFLLIKSDFAQSSRTSNIKAGVELYNSGATHVYWPPSSTTISQKVYSPRPPPQHSSPSQQIDLSS